MTIAPLFERILLSLLAGVCVWAMLMLMRFHDRLESILIGMVDRVILDPSRLQALSEKIERARAMKL